MDKTNANSKYLTYNYIIEQFDTIATNHNMINHFFCGPMEEVDIKGIERDRWPILYIEPSGIDIDNFTQTFSFEVAVLDSYHVNESYNSRRLKTDDDVLQGGVNTQGLYTDLYSLKSQMRNITLNDAYMCMQDIVASFIQNFQTASWINTEVDLQLPVTLTPISTQYDNMLSGWTSTFRITANNKNDLCKTMMIDQE